MNVEWIFKYYKIDKKRKFINNYINSIIFVIFDNNFFGAISFVYINRNIQFIITYIT